ncbi:unnamed protein product [Brassica rapa subsp. trilocularis]
MFSFSFLKARRDQESIPKVYTLLKRNGGSLVSGDHKRDRVSKFVEFLLEINIVRIHQIDIYGSCRVPEILGINTTVSYLRCLAPR